MNTPSYNVLLNKEKLIHTVQDLCEEANKTSASVNDEQQRAEGVEGDLNTRLETVEELATISVSGGDIGIATAADFDNPDAEARAKVPTVGAIYDSIDDFAVYDISAHNNGATYANLAAALGTNGANVPVNIRKGGMSVQYVNSSDNKYVRFNYLLEDATTNSKFTNIANWQGVTSEVNTDSKDLIESRGVNAALVGVLDNIATINGQVGVNNDVIKIQFTKEAYKYLTKGILLKNSGNVQFNSTTKDYRTSDYIKLPNSAQKINYKNIFPKISNWVGLCLYNENKEFISSNASISQTGTLQLSDYPTAQYFRFTSFYAAENNFVNSIIEVVVNDNSNKGTLLERVSELEAVNNPQLCVNSILPNAAVTRTISGAKTIFAINLGKVREGKIRIVGSATNSWTVYWQIYTPNFNNVYNKNIPAGEFDETFDLAYILNVSQINSDNVAKIVMTANSSNWNNDTHTISKIFASTELANSLNIVTMENAIGEIRDDIDSIVTVEEGSYGSLKSTLNRALTQSTLVGVTLSNIACSDNGYITKINITTNASGVMTFAVGLLDQRSNAVNLRTFNVTIPNAGNNTITLDKPVYIAQGEQLFAFVDENITVKWSYGNTVSDAETQVMASQQGAYNRYTSYHDLNPSAFPYGIVTNFNYTLVIYKSVFEEKEDVELVKEQVNNLSNLVQSAGIVYDENSSPYRLYIYDGQLRFKSLTYTKVVALGNSLTDHSYAANIGWLTKTYSMAATRKSTSWTEQFAKILKKYNVSAQVIPFNIYMWELNPQIDPSTIVTEDRIQGDIRRLEDVLTSDVDCVIFRAGENASAEEKTQQDYENGLTNLVNYIKTKCPLADIIISQLMWHNAMKDTAFYNVATSLGLKFIDTGTCGNKKELLGDICKNYDESANFPIIHSGVAAHVDDYGFYLFANILANACGLSQNDELHNIIIDSSITYVLNRNEGVYGSIKTIQTFGTNHPTVVATDSEGNNISVEHIDMSSVVWINTPANVPTWCSIFVMPNSDVSITIS